MTNKIMPALLLCTSVLAPVSFAAAQSPTFALTLLDSKAGPASGPNGHNVNELSGLAWDADDKLLYAVSDDGVLHHFRVEIKDNKIASMEPVFSVQLATGTTPALVNAEGLAVVNGENGVPSDGELLVAFEDGPAIHRFKPDGMPVEAVALPGTLSDVAQYNEPNSRLEAVAATSDRGIVTAPEEAMQGQPGDTHTIYGLDGGRWTFPTFQPKRSNLKAIETMPGGQLLVLERTRETKGGPSIGRLRVVDPQACAAETCTATELDAGASTLLNDNFEGMARLTDELYLAVTDKTKKETPSTQFVLFSVSKPD
ncbi:esterase-like activity of phytase family protein (plasmid) [Aminobacter sp. P9b]|uniref:esterase-like activity of phytase family protein n=1 Tax=Aminobacter sp. P9b TaxID=3133697 RepID=UPI0031382D87